MNEIDEIYERARTLRDNCRHDMFWTAVGTVLLSVLARRHEGAVALFGGGAVMASLCFVAFAHFHSRAAQIMREIEAEKNG